MYINGENYRLTKHGRQRFLERVETPVRYSYNANGTGKPGIVVDDNAIITTAVNGKEGFEFVWVPNVVNGVLVNYRLVTVLDSE